MVGGTWPSGPCCPSPRPGEGTAPTPGPCSDLTPQSLWPLLAFLALRIPCKAPGGPGHLDQRRPSWAHLCPLRPPPSGSLLSFLLGGPGGGLPTLAGIGDAPSDGPSRGVGSRYGPWMGPLAPFASQRRSARWTLPVREGVGLRRLQAQAAVPWSTRRQLGWALTPPAAPGRFQSISWPQEQGLRLEPEVLTRPEAARTAGNPSPPGGDCDDQGRPTLPAGGVDHVPGSQAPEL